MRAADHFGRVIAHLRDAENELQATFYAAPEQRRRIKGELASLRTQQRRLGDLRNRELGEGWGRFIAISRGQGADK